MKKVVIGNCILYCGDSRELMREQEYFADCIVSDPPYPLTAGGKNTSKLGGILSKENYNNDGHIVECDITWDEIMDIFYRALSDGHCYSFCNSKNIQDMLNSAEKAGFRFHNMLVWMKSNAVVNKQYMKNCEFNGLFFKGNGKTINDPGTKSCIEAKLIKQTNHPTEKPVSLLETYIKNSTQEGQVVFDPFMGTGATGIAAINTGRRFIGCELDPVHFEEACERIQKHQDLMILLTDPD